MDHRETVDEADRLIDEMWRSEIRRHRDAIIGIAITAGELQHVVATLPAFAECPDVRCECRIAMQEAVTYQTALNHHVVHLTFKTLGESSLNIPKEEAARQEQVAAALDAALAKLDKSASGELKAWQVIAGELTICAAKLSAALNRRLIIHRSNGRDAPGAVLLFASIAYALATFSGGAHADMPAPCADEEASRYREWVIARALRSATDGGCPVPYRDRHLVYLMPGGIGA